MAGINGMMSTVTDIHGMHMHHMMMMHMNFFWGKSVEIGMYVLILIVVFLLSVLVEWLSYCRLIKPGTNNILAGLVQTIVHGIRVCLSYLVMLVILSFDIGVLLVAVAGHSVGFLFFGSSLFRHPEVLAHEKTSNFLSHF